MDGALVARTANQLVGGVDADVGDDGLICSSSDFINLLSFHCVEHSQQRALVGRCHYYIAILAELECCDVAIVSLEAYYFLLLSKIDHLHMPYLFVWEGDDALVFLSRHSQEAQWVFDGDKAFRQVKVLKVVYIYFLKYHHDHPAIHQFANQLTCPFGASG